MALVAVVGGLVACGATPGAHRGPPPSAALRTSPTPTPPASPAAIAQVLGEVEEALRSPATPASADDALGVRQQEAYEALGAHPDWLDAVLGAVPAGVHDAVQDNAMAGAELEQLDAGSGPSNHLPDWRIVAPLPAPTLLDDYHAAEAQFGVPWTYLAAINFVETRMGRIEGDSSAGAQGPMQFLPSTWAIYGQGNIDDAHDAILGAARFLAATGAPSDMPSALFAYNPSQLYVDAVTRYAAVMQADDRAYLGYHAWQVTVATTRGTVVLPEGYGVVSPSATRPRAP